MNIGTNIKRLRLQRRETQRQLAEHLGVSSQAVSKWENNASAPDISLLFPIAGHFGVTIDELLAERDGKNAHL